MMKDLDRRVAELKKTHPLFPGETEAILAVTEAGEKYGYGNMIGHLATAWAQKLLDDGVPMEVAIKSVHGTPYVWLLKAKEE